MISRRTDKQTGRGKVPEASHPQDQLSAIRFGGTWSPSSARESLSVLFIGEVIVVFSILKDHVLDLNGEPIYVTRYQCNPGV